MRPLLHAGRTIRGPELDGAWLHGVVSHDQTHGAFSYVRLVSGAAAMPGLVRLHGLDPKRTYAVRALDVTGRDEVRIAGQAAATPPWTRHGVTLSGDALMRRGLAMPVLDPMAGLLFEVSATDHEGR
ncbi:GH36 C-terminal domain-containing protein [Ornithinimicrobium sp. INDO-MA30-4]|nr:GH36 C-terminal domain-containing protein [Ornithinimicrobium sp. INDO-MA30-4]